MATRNRESSLRQLDLPAEFEDLTGLLETDLRAIVSVLVERADERLMLTTREKRQLRANLWNRLTHVLNQTVEPLSADRR
jgi:hypothetical protein